MKAELLFNDGMLIRLKPEEKRLYTIGRSPQSDIYLPNSDLAVSNKHATLFLNDDETWVINDGDLVNNRPSRGGIKINGERLNPEYGYELKHNDLVELSPLTSFHFFLLETDARPEGDTIL